MEINLSKLSENARSMTISEYEEYVKKSLNVIVRNLKPDKTYLAIYHGMFYVGKFTIDEKNNILFNGYRFTRNTIECMQNVFFVCYTERIIEIPKKYESECYNISYNLYKLHYRVSTFLNNPHEVKKIKLFSDIKRQNKFDFFVKSLSDLLCEYNNNLSITLGEIAAKQKKIYDKYVTKVDSYIKAKESCRDYVLIKLLGQDSVSVFIPDNIGGFKENGRQIFLNMNYARFENEIKIPYTKNVYPITDEDDIKYVKGIISGSSKELRRMTKKLFNMFYYQK